MGNRGHVFDHADLQTGSLQRTDRSFTAGARTLYIYFNGFQSMFHRSFRSGFRSRLRSKRSRLFGASEAQAAGACPAERITLYIGNGYDGIVESGLDMSRTAFDILLLTASAGGFFCYLFVLPFDTLLLTSSCWPWSFSDPYGYERSSWCAVLLRAGLFCDADRGSIRFRSIF